MINGNLEFKDIQKLKNIYNKIDVQGYAIEPLSTEEQILIYSLSIWIENYFKQEKEVMTVLDKIEKEHSCKEAGQQESYNSYHEGWRDAVDRVRQKLIGKKLKEDDWIPCTERLPEEKTNPFTQDWYTYPVTIEIDGVRDIRYYMFGKGHWWHGPGCMDKYVVAWKDVTKPYNPGKMMNQNLYKYVYGNRYIMNVEEGEFAKNQEDLKSAALDFLDSLPDYQIDNFCLENGLPEDWYESVFGTCTEIDKPLEDCQLGIHATYDIV